MEYLNLCGDNKVITCFISGTHIVAGIDSPKSKKKKSGGKTKIYDYFGSKYKKESFVFKICL